jgi:hypothetical protein
LIDREWLSLWALGIAAVALCGMLASLPKTELSEVRA